MEEHLKNYIASYEITGTLLESPEGSLYKALDPSSGDSVLIKVYFPSLTWPEPLLNEFFDRFSYLRFIEHDNLLPILDLGKHEEVPYVVYPYLASEHLGAAALQRLDEKKILTIFYEIADALDFLHKQEILHGMLEAENILIDAGGHPRLFDYGLTEILRKLLLENIGDGFHNLSLSRVNSYSPEQIQGRTLTRQSDMYSFGLLLFYGLSGSYPFESKLAAEIAAWHLDPGTTSVVLLRKRMSRHTLRFIQKCIQVQPEKRFSGFAEVLRVLDRTRQGKGTRLTFHPRLKPVPPPQPKPRAWWYALPVLLLIGLTAWLYVYSAAPQTLPTEPPAAAWTVTATATVIPTATEAATLPTDEPPMVEPTPAEEAVYRPALEDERPAAVSESISADTIQKVRELSRLGYGKPEHADISPVSRYSAIATSAGVFIYDGNRLETWLDPEGWATAVQFSADGKLLAVGLKSGEIQLWDWANGVRTSTLAGHSGRITQILFSANGRSMYSASFDQHVLVWNLASQTIAQDIPAHSDAVNDIAVSSDNRMLITCSDDKFVRVWDLAANAKLYEMPFSEELKALALSSDDVYMAVAGETGYIRQFNVRTRQLRTDPIPAEGRVWSLEYVENDKTLLAGIDGGESRRFTAAQLHYGGGRSDFGIRPFSAPLFKIYGFDFQFNSYTVAPDKTSTNDVLTIRWDGQVQRNGTTLMPPVFDSQERLDFSDDGMELAVSGKQRLLSAWDLAKNQILYQAEARLPAGDPITPDGKYLLVEQDSLYQLVSLNTSADSRELSARIAGGTISYANKGTILITGNLRQSKVWDYRSGYEIFFDYHPENGCLVTTSANDQQVLQVISAAGVVAPWSEDTKRFCAKSFPYSNSLSAVSSDIQVFVYRNSGGLVEGFDTVNNKALWKYPAQGKPETKVLALAISSDGSIVAIGNEKGGLVLLDGRDGRVLAELTGNFGSVQAVELSSDGTKIATAGSDGTVRIFGVIQ